MGLAYILVLNTYKSFWKFSLIKVNANDRRDGLITENAVNLKVVNIFFSYDYRVSVFRTPCMLYFTFYVSHNPIVGSRTIYPNRTRYVTSLITQMSVLTFG